MAVLLALMLTTRKHFEAWLLAAMFGSLADMARHSIGDFATIALHRHINVARGTGAWVAKNITRIMLAILILLFLAILTAGVR